MIAYKHNGKVGGAYVAYVPMGAYTNLPAGSRVFDFRWSDPDYLFMLTAIGLSLINNNTPAQGSFMRVCGRKNYNYTSFASGGVLLPSMGARKRSDMMPSADVMTRCVARKASPGSVGLTPSVCYETDNIFDARVYSGSNKGVLVSTSINDLNVSHNEELYVENGEGLSLLFEDGVPSDCSVELTLYIRYMVLPVEAYTNKGELDGSRWNTL